MESALYSLLESSRLVIVQPGIGKFNGGDKVTTSFADYDIWITLSGQFLLTVNGKNYTARRGDAFLMAPDTVLSLEAALESTQLFCHFIPEYAGQIGLKGEFTDHTVPRENDGLVTLLQSLLEELVAGMDGDGGRLQIKLLLKLILTKMVGANPPGSFSPGGGGRIGAAIKPALDHIHGNPGEGHTVKKLASLANLSETYFSRIFREQTGQNPKRYADGIRMEYARTLLLQAMTVKQTAFELGFSDPYAFSRRFKQIFGVPPSKIASQQT